MLLGPWSEFRFEKADPSKANATDAHPSHKTEIAGHETMAKSKAWH